jgi:hypothetical protein
LPSSGCSTKGLNDLVQVDGGADVKAQVKAILHELFPALTPAEIEELAASLELQAAISLKAELEAIRAEVERLSKELFTTAEDRAKKREEDLLPANGGFPSALEPIGQTGFFDRTSGEGWIELSGIFSGRAAVPIVAGDVSVTVGGAAPSTTLECLGNGTPVDIVFLVDVTGSMTSVIGGVRDSLSRFISAIADSKIAGTIGVVTYQDTVGVNVAFQQPKPAVERSPFFAPVPIGNAAQMEALQRFVTRLEANAGGDRPENLAAAIDFARNNVIGYTKAGKPNVIGDGVEDPPATSAWPKLTNGRQIFVVFTDATFHADSRTPSTSSLPNGFKPRSMGDIVQSLRSTRTVVHVSDPSWVDETTTPTGAAGEVEVDADYWARETGGVGMDKVLGYSLTDLELVIVAKSTGLLDISLHSILASTCRVRFTLPSLSAGATFSLQLSHAGQAYTTEITPISW